MLIGETVTWLLPVPVPISITFFTQVDESANRSYCTMRIEEYLYVVVQRRLEELVVVHENQNMVTGMFKQSD